jgi:hypothetical protein
MELVRNRPDKSQLCIPELQVKTSTNLEEQAALIFLPSLS